MRVRSDKIRAAVVVVAFAGTIAGMNAAWAVTELRASVSQNQMTLADTVEYRVEITGDAAVAGTQPQPPDFRSAGFEVIGGPSSEQRISIINNMQAAPSLTVRWLLRPMREGELQIGPTRVPVVGGQTMESSPVQVTVSKMPAAAPGGGAAPIKPGEEIYSARTGNEAIDRQLRDRLFLRPVIDKTDAYVGEQITLTYELCQAEGLNISGYGYEQLPSYPGFMVQTLYEPPRGQLQFRRQSIAGVTFQIAPIQTVALFANKNGATTIPAVVLAAEIPVSRGARRRMPSVFDDLFLDDPFFQDTVRARLVARPIAIRVLSLPTEGRPADFSGTVGDYRMTAAFDRPEVRQYDLVTLKVQFSGKGQLDAISPPRLPTVTGFERFKEQSGAAGGAKTFEFLLRPTEAGDVRFPAIEYAVFDPAHKQYERLQTPVLTLRVLPAPKPEKPIIQVFTPPTPGPGGETPSSVVELNRDIEYIRTTDFLRHGLMAVPLYEQPAFLAFQLVPVVLLGASYAVRRRRERREGDVAWARRRSARSVASKRLRGARKLLSAPDGSRFFDELSRALRQFVADQGNESAAGLTGERIAHLLGERGVESAAVEEMVQVLDLCEAARYASARPDLAEMRRVFDRASELIDRLAKELR